MEESKLIFSLDPHTEAPTVAFSNDKPQDLSLGMDLELTPGPPSQPTLLHHSPSSPGSLGDLSSSSAEVLISTNLVKSSSIELEPRENSSLRGKPLLSLVKSLSTEISRRVEPKVNLSKSDSKLHLHPWKQHTQPKIPEVGAEAAGLSEDDDWASPPSTGSMSPGEPRGSSLRAELEDTQRRFSEAMQDPLSVLSKIMGDESPKQARASGAGDSPASHGSGEREMSSDDVELKCRRRNDACDSPLRRIQKGPSSEIYSRDSRLEICTYGDVIQVVELKSSSKGGHRRPCPQYRDRDRVRVPVPSLPLYWLLPVGLLAYGFFVLPLPPYVAGLSLGVACGFILGLVVVFTFAPRSSTARSGKASRSSQSGAKDGNQLQAEVLEGWMNETHDYDPETFHPSMTHAVHVTLEAGRLCLAHPRAGGAPRWAAFGEPQHEAVFSHARTYQLAQSKVSLLPPGLARKRLWNKKYPICIVLAEGESAEESLVEEEEGLGGPATVDHQLPVTLYLFGRTGREKEEWFQQFLSASKAGGKGSVSGEENTEATSAEDAVRDNTEEVLDPPGAVRSRRLSDYSAYMSQLIGTEGGLRTASPCPSDRGSPSTHRKSQNEENRAGARAAAESSAGSGPAEYPVDDQPTWVNSLVGRIFWDFLQEKYWSDQVAHKIQKKLSKIKLPYFMNELTLADLDMGTGLPQVLSTSKPTLDRRGLWLELELIYTGCLQMTLETKMNLCKLGKEGEDEAPSVPETQQEGSKPRLCILADSDEESSSAASSDEEEMPPHEPQGSVGDKTSVAAAEGHTGGSTSRKILRFVDKIAKSKYFQKATKNEYIRKKIAEVSNMPLMLSVEVLELSGTLAVNIPPPPTDRIWYSFRVPPRLELHVRPMLGEREVTFTHVTEWIEKKLQCEFQKVFVMPNMDDLYLPLMTSGLENLPASHQSSVQSTSQQSSVESQDYMSE
ncbi:testis-expressed protein 2-like isoform X2 [Betta splendens]|uniref:Testis-expressed protein 2-like isoform X2 n=1 Tax=Betta splendens TaxID=158456 RepID=A0A6P7N9R7_BETSP|nr:testis-expressed protein 2-like isoform X2 [Betta splendens]